MAGASTSAAAAARFSGNSCRRIFLLLLRNQEAYYILFLRCAIPNRTSRSAMDNAANAPYNPSAELSPVFADPELAVFELFAAVPAPWDVFLPFVSGIVSLDGVVLLVTLWVFVSVPPSVTVSESEMYPFTLSSFTL